jgi:tripartite-type tricarboxylate transporter receptor subunit TctC
MLLCAAALPLAGRAASAQSPRFPSRAITFLVPYAPGGAFDVTIRALSKAAEPMLGQPITVVNKPGAGGAIMLGDLAKAKPDGHTIGSLNVNINAVAPHMQDLPLDPIGDFTPIMNYGAFTTFVAVPKGSEFTSFKQLIEAARKSPGIVTVGISSIGANSHLAMSRLVAQEKVEVTFVPFGGGAPATTALLGNHVSCAVVSGEILPHVRDGNLRLLALFNDTRVPEFPNLPTLLDLGYGWASNPWMGVGGPKGMPPEIVKQLQDVLLEAMQAEIFRTAMTNLAVIPKPAGAADLAKLMRESLEEHGAIVKALKIGKYER